MELDQKRAAALCRVTTATLTTLLLKKGLRNVWMRGTSPIRTGQARVAGRAFTLRFIPAREDQATPESWAKPVSTRTAIEAMPAGCIAIVDARGVTGANFWRHSLRAHAPAGSRGADHRWRRARRSRRARNGLADLVFGSGGAAFGRRTDVRELAGADRLWRCRRVSR